MPTEKNNQIGTDSQLSAMDEPQLFSVGNLVEVAKIESPGKTFHPRGDAFILDPNHEGGVLVQYILKGKKVVSPQRILKEKRLDTVSRQRACDKVSRPSLLSTFHSSKRKLDTSTTTTEKRDESHSIRPVWKKLKDSKSWESQTKGRRIDRHPILAYLKAGQNKERGWLRREEAAARGIIIQSDKKRAHLDPTEKHLLARIRQCIEGLTEYKQGSKKFKPMSDLAHAFGVGKTQTRTVGTNELETNGTNKCKQRSDAGETLFNSDKKRKLVWTAEHYHRKKQCILYRGDGLTEQEIKASFVQLSPMELLQCRAGAERMKDMLVNIDELIGKVLRKTNGTVSWQTIACEVAGGPNKVQPVSANSIAKYVMSTFGARYTTTKLQPTMNVRNKKQRFDWSKHFFLFFEGAKLFWPKSQLLYIHLDEKWFYCLVIRSNNKWVPYFGVTPDHHNQHHKNSADKVLAIACVGFLPNENDPKNGGEAVPINITRCGRMKQAKKDTYQRVYNKNGTYTMPPIPENWLRVKGEWYFENMEITGSSRFKKGKEKFPMLDHWRDTLWPEIDRVRAHFSQKMNKKIVVVNQDDNASSHREDQFLEYMKMELSNRGGILAPQPPNSPTTNVLNDYVFPSMSKLASTAQGLKNGGRTLKEEQLWSIVKRVFYSYDKAKLARAFVHHQQVAAAIFSDMGGNEYDKLCGAGHFNVRSRSVVPVYNDEDDWERGAEEDEHGNLRVRRPIGVRYVDTLEDDEVPSHKQGETLKYPTPNLEHLDLCDYLSEEELSLIANEIVDVVENLPPGSSFDYETFGRYYNAWEEKSNMPESVDEY